METPFDWLSLLLFAGLVVLMLQRSTAETPPDKLWHYGPPAIALALTNYLGNHGYPVPAIAGLIAVIAYIFFVLRPRIFH